MRKETVIINDQAYDLKDLGEKFKPGDKVIISKNSTNLWIRGMKGTVVRFLEADNVPGNLYQWTYEVKLEDGDKSYVPQWEMVLEGGAKHYCIFEITQPNILSELYKVSSVLDYGEDYTAADKMYQALNYLRPKNKFVYFLLRCLDQEEFDAVQDFLKTNPHGDVSEVYSPFIQKIVVTKSMED